MAKRILILLLCVLYIGCIYVLFIDTSLLDVFNKNQPTIEEPSETPGTEEPSETPGTEEPGEEPGTNKPIVNIVDNNKQFTVDFNNLNSENVYRIDLNVKEKYTFNLVGVDDFDYKCFVINQIPSEDYEFYFNISSKGLYNRGFITQGIYEENGENTIWEWLYSIGQWDYSDGFIIEETAKNIKFAMPYDNLDAFLDDFFNEDVKCVDFGKPYNGVFDGNMLGEDFFKEYAFKLKIRKVSTNEEISFLLCFKNNS